MTTAAGALALTLAYRPFLDPIPGFATWWWLTIIPLAFLISMTYKAVRANNLKSMPRYWKRVGVMTLQIIALMLALAAGLQILVEFVAPAIS